MSAPGRKWFHVGQFYCVYCGPCEVQEDNGGNTVVIHNEDVEHPIGYTCDEESRPQ